MPAAARTPHSTSTVVEARRLHEAGWSIYAVAKLLRRRGISVDETTIAEWVDPKLAERRRDEQARRFRALSARRSRGRLGAGPPRSGEFRLERMKSLRALGVSYSDIAKTMSFDFPDEPITEDKVRHALRTDTIPRAYRGVGLRKVAA